MYFFDSILFINSEIVMKSILHHIAYNTVIETPLSLFPCTQWLDQIWRYIAV